MNDQILDNETIFNNMGGTVATEDGLYIESATAFGNMIHSYPNRCGRAEVEVVKMSLSQLVNEDDKILSIERIASRNAIILTLALTAISVLLAAKSGNIWIFRFVLYFWFCAYLNGVYRKSASYYGEIIAHMPMQETKKYNHAYSQVINAAREKKDIPTYEEAAEASPYLEELKTESFAESNICIVRSIADSLVLIAISTCINMTWIGNNSIAIKLLLSVVFLLAGAVLITIQKDLISDFIYRHRKSKWIMVLAQKPFMAKPDYKHYETAITALVAYCRRERYINEHLDEYQVAYSIIDVSEGKIIFTLVNGDVAIIYF